MFCPSSADEVATQLVASLPRGPAWQTHDAGPRPGSWLYGFWRSMAEAFFFVYRRLCALRLEFWCATHVETRDLWMAEYGLPDACDPFPDLCAKVAALNGARCADLEAVAVRAGWDVECREEDGDCGDRAGEFYAGQAEAGGAIDAAIVKLLVRLDSSPAFVGQQETAPFAGLLEAGLPLACDPDITSLRCLMERVAHAHVSIEYEFGAPRTILTDAPIRTDSGQTIDGLEAS